MPQNNLHRKIELSELIFNKEVKTQTTLERSKLIYNKEVKTQSQNNWKHILTFCEATSHIVKSNEWQKTQSTSI